MPSCIQFSGSVLKGKYSRKNEDKKVKMFFFLDDDGRTLTEHSISAVFSGNHCTVVPVGALTT